MVLTYGPYMYGRKYFSGSMTVFRLMAEEEAKIRTENEKIKVLNKVRLSKESFNYDLN